MPEERIELGGGGGGGHLHSHRTRSRPWYRALMFTPLYFSDNDLVILMDRYFFLTSVHICMYVCVYVCVCVCVCVYVFFIQFNVPFKFISLISRRANR